MNCRSLAFLLHLVLTPETNSWTRNQTPSPASVFRAQVVSSFVGMRTRTFMHSIHCPNAPPLSSRCLQPTSAMSRASESVLLAPRWLLDHGIHKSKSGLSSVSWVFLQLGGLSSNRLYQLADTKISLYCQICNRGYWAKSHHPAILVLIVTIMKELYSTSEKI